MTPWFREYRYAHERMVEARDCGHEAEEDRWLDRLEVIWDCADGDGREEIRSFVAGNV